MLIGGALNVAHAQVLSLQSSLEDPMARIITDIGDAQHLFETETGEARDVAKEDLLRLQQLLEERKKMMTSVEITDGGLKDTQDDIVMGDNTSDGAAKQVLINNTITNAVSSMRAGTLVTVTPVWKHSQHHQRKASVAAIADQIWKKSIPLKVF